MSNYHLKQTYIQIITIFHYPNLFVYYTEKNGVDQTCVNTLNRNWVKINYTNERSIIGSK